MPLVNVRLSDGERDRWRRAAEQRGMTLTGFLKAAVEEAIGVRSSKVLAAAIATELAPLLKNGSVPSHVTPSSVPYRPFDRQCDNFDVHELGVVCSICGGSEY